MVPQKVAAGRAERGVGYTSPDGRVKGVRVKPGKEFAYLPSLGFEVLASPHDVVEVASWSPTVVAGGRNVVVQLGK